ncbi:acetyl-coenzyme A transporter 1 [Bacillus rossius redtenbacheri]|uniref:acetyl-coenzyme A transporter 1 n=1 Tax=Bacillus rossius redtenbacheri TaxID=93214 RepID=UPI002FDCF842
MSTRKRTVTTHNGLEDGGVDGYISGREHVASGNMKGDEKNIAILFFLYLLQGIPLGLSAAIPMYLQNRGVSYKQQAEFSFSHWPFSMKLLWAPVVDSVYSSWFGRRKSWLIPTQYLIGLFMLYLSSTVEGFLGGDAVSPNVSLLTFFFFVLSFLAATQDIAVDGWALTMLKRCNVGYASTCNSVGQTAGYFLGYVVFVGLESPEFCNTYLRSTPSTEGLITLSGFLYFWGIVFLITTTLVALLKSEKCGENSGLDDPNTSVKESYLSLWNIIKLPSIRTTMLVLLTCKIAFSACDAVTSLKLIDAGVPKEKLALMAIPMVPLQIILPLVISKYTTGPRPMDVFIAAYPYRLCFGVVAAFIVWITPILVQDGVVPLYYYGLLLVSYWFHQVTLYCMFVAVMAFFARVSDPAVGGTYMTLLNTLSNLGGNWPSTLALWLVDALTSRGCSQEPGNPCSSPALAQECTEAGGQCLITLDGYYIESLICFLLGWLWLSWGKRKIQELQLKGDSDWLITKRRSR